MWTLTTLRRRGAPWAAAAGLLLAATTASAASFNFAGVADSGPLAGQAFSGQFAYDDTAWMPGLDGDLPLTHFALSLGGQHYSLASADAPASATFAGGSLVGLSYVDLDTPTPDAALQVALVPGYTALDEAYLAYETAQALAGFGSYSVSAVPEPSAAALLLAGLGAVAWRRRAARREQLQQPLEPAAEKARPDGTT